MMAKTIRVFLLAAGLTLMSGLLFSQNSPQSSSAAASSSAQSVQPSGADPADAVKAKGNTAPENADEEEENSQFKYSFLVRKVAVGTGLSKQAVYWTFVVINFLILAAGLVWVVKKMLPNGFAPRAAEITKGLEDARKASAEAAAQLGAIEGRLARLDTEIAELKIAAEADFSIEEQRIKAAAEEDAKNVVASAELEIAAAARIAQRDLKAFAAGLAVDLAEKKIKVDDAVDEALVSGFAAQLGKDGR